MDNIIIDSSLTLEQALSQKFESEPPREVLDRQKIIDVEYFTFDGTLHRGQIVVDQDLVSDVKEAFDLIKRIEFPLTSVIPIGDLRFLNEDEKSAYANNTTCFNYRNIAKLNKISNHSLGRAIDINPAINPYIRDDYWLPQGVNYDPTRPGAIVKGGEIYSLFINRGWEWGGDWTDRKDYQHFEKPVKDAH